jgi:hypothetical protein
MSQQDRKAQEGEVVRRLTIGAGAVALSLAGYFTVSSATAVPLAFGAQPEGGQGATLDGGQVNDRVFIRKVHLPPPSAPAGGVKAAATSRGAGGGTTAAAGAAQPAAGVTRPAGGAAPAAAPPVVAVAPPPTPKPTPVATTGGSTPPK